MAELTIPDPYLAWFTNRLVLVTGVGRSGTTIVGKIVGSLEHAHYLFEPAAIKLLPVLQLDAGRERLGYGA